MQMTVRASEVIETIRQHWSGGPGVLVEISKDALTCIVLHDDAWRATGFDIESVHVLLPGKDDTLRDHLADLGGLIYKIGFVMGDDVTEARIDILREVFGTRFISILSNGRLPRRRDRRGRTDLENYLRNLPGKAPYTLAIIPAYLSGGSAPHLVRDKPQEVLLAGQEVQRGQTLRPVTLAAPTTEEPLLLVFQAGDEEYAYLVQADANIFRVVVFFEMDLTWTIHLGRAHLVEERRFGPFAPGELQPALIFPAHDRHFTQVVLAVESTLGMQRLISEKLEASNGLPLPLPAQAVDFRVVWSFCRTLAAALNDETVRLLVLFYGDTEPPPGEYRADLPDGSGEVIRLLLPDFAPTSIVHEALDPDHASVYQTASRDWHKAVEQALYYLNESVAWGAGARFVVWIGQGPHHFYVAANENPPPDAPSGYTTPINFQTELEKSRDLKHFVIFADGDIPTRDLREAALESTWKPIAPDDIQPFYFDAEDRRAMELLAGRVLDFVGRPEAAQVIRAQRTADGVHQRPWPLRDGEQIVFTR